MSRISDVLFNPFRWIGGGKALLIGIIISALTAIISFFSRVHFPDIISIKLGPSLPILFLIIQSILNWFVFGVILFILSYLITKSKYRFIDVIGCQSLARFPFLLAAPLGFIPGTEKFTKFLLNMQLGIGEPVTITDTEIGLALMVILLMLLISIWSIVMMYRGFSISVNAKGGKAVVVFVISLIASMIVTLLTSTLMFHHIDVFKV